jgi:hypothetical protein
MSWSPESRREMMRDVVRLIAELGALRLENAPRIAATYGPHITTAEVEAEMMKHMTEGEGK